MQSLKQQNDLCSFPSQIIQYHRNPSLCPITNAKEAEAERFYKDLQDSQNYHQKKKNVSSGRLRQGGRGGGGPAVSLERGAAGLAAEDGELRKKYCVYCLAEVSPLRFRCAECQDIELCPCPGCFSAGAEIRHHHRRYHGYQLMDGGRFTLWGPEATGAGPAARSSCCWMPWSSSASGTGRTWQLTSALPGPPRK